MNGDPRTADVEPNNEQPIQAQCTPTNTDMTTKNIS